MGWNKVKISLKSIRFFAIAKLFMKGRVWGTKSWGGMGMRSKKEGEI